MRQIFIGESNIMKKLFYDKYTANCLIQIRNFLLNKILIDGLAWFGLLVDYCDVFISCLDSHSDGIHLLQMIHWWASDVMLNFSKYCIFWCMFIYILESLRVNPFSEKNYFWVNHSFIITKETIRLLNGSNQSGRVLKFVLVFSAIQWIDFLWSISKYIPWH